jgi:hypothetical protein
MGFFTGTPGTPGGIVSKNMYNPAQQAALKTILTKGLGSFNQMGMNQPQGFNPSQQDIYQGFAPIEQQARTGFAQQTVPSLAERFSSMGNNALSSPSFASQLGQAGSGMEQGLAALRSQYGMQNRQQLGNEYFRNQALGSDWQNRIMQILGMGLGQQGQQYAVPGQPAQPGFLQSLGGGLGQAVGTGLSMLPFLL